MQDYFTKLQMYINSDTLPDYFWMPERNYFLKHAKILMHWLMWEDELERNGYDEKLNGAIRDFLTDADDGKYVSLPTGIVL